MSTTRGIADSADLRASNVARALSEIRRKGGAARVDLVEALELSPATVSAVISELLEADLIIEAPATAAAGRGRPRIQLSLNPKARFVAGAKLGDDKVTVAILDFCGEVLSTGEIGTDAPTVDASTLLTKIDIALKRALDGAGLKDKDIAAFGLGVPGFIEIESGLCLWSPVLSGAPIDLRSLLARRLSCPIFVDNDANLATMAELWFGYGRDERDFLVVTVENGVGLGIVLDNRLFRGARGLGAEFGHTKVQIDGALCRCGQRGCLEAYVSDYAIAREAGLAVEGSVRPDEILDRLAEQAKAGHDVSASIYRRAGRMLGLGLANLLNIFDPPLIVLAGEHIQNHELLAEEIERTIAANSLSVNRPAARVAVHRWGSQLWARGAGALALDGLMSRTPLDQEELAG